MSDAASKPSAPPRRRKRGARFVEIAEAAGVSIATVNRVLNDHGSVAPATRARVVAAARQLAVPRVLPDLRHGLTRLDVILARSPTPLFRRIEQALQQATQLLDRRIVVHRHVLEEDDDDQIAHAILRPRPRRDGLALAVHDTPRVRDALRSVVAQGVRVVTLVSDIGEVPRLHYAGIDNLHAGRTAGWFLGRLARRPGRVLVLSNSLAFRAHVDRTAGCRAVIAERFPQLACSETRECFDDPDRAYHAVNAALRARGGELVGVYHSGAGSAGIAAALERAGRLGEVAWVGHEMTEAHRGWLARGAMDLVIDQDPDGQVRSTLQHLLHACGWLEAPPAAGPNEFRLFCAENLPPPRPADEPGVR
ncbi:MAG: LacI family DNA-binding transcriptional regulator [Burkholderiales bacterium]|nr:LacI family DNA-binding transcriptional regulator [Burkholderiales bacterium]MDE2452354.1 LacI family DNA-binding transcriptional regulator [Burkholderiales bacterium]